MTAERPSATLDPRAVRFEIGDPAGLGEDCFIAGWLFVPSEGRCSAPPLAMVLLPGGSYSKAYYHQVIPGHRGYSAASYFAERGAVVLAIDHLGTGESTMPEDGARVTLEAMAAANARTIEMFRDRLGKGELTPDLPPMPLARMIGVGHSLGGYLAHIQQAQFESYDAVAVLGSTCQLMVGLEDPNLAQREILPTERAGYFLMPRAQNHDKFYDADVPAEVVAADDLTLSPLPMGMMDIGQRGRTADYAAKIAVPIFVAFGERDLSPDPHAEPAFYRACSDITFFILPRSGHCHNSASTRDRLWGRLGSWIDTLPTAENVP